MFTGIGNGKPNDREQRVIELVAQGLKNREVADKIGTTEHVIKNYLRTIYDKLGRPAEAEQETAKQKLERAYSSRTCIAFGRSTKTGNVCRERPQGLLVITVSVWERPRGVRSCTRSEDYSGPSRRGKDKKRRENKKKKKEARE
jgi:transposase